MSLSNYEHASQSLAKEIISKDIEWEAKMYEKNVYVAEIYHLFRQRLSLYDKFSSLPLSRPDRLLLDSKKTEIIMELKLFKFKQHVEEEISQLSCRLNALEVQRANFR